MGVSNHLLSFTALTFRKVSEYFTASPYYYRVISLRAVTVSLLFYPCHNAYVRSCETDLTDEAFGNTILLTPLEQLMNVGLAAFFSLILLGIFRNIIFLCLFSWGRDSEVMCLNRNDVGSTFLITQWLGSGIFGLNIPVSTKHLVSDQLIRLLSTCDFSALIYVSKEVSHFFFPSHHIY